MDGGAKGGMDGETEEGMDGEAKDPATEPVGQTTSLCASKNHASEARTGNDHCLSRLPATGKDDNDSQPVQNFVFPAHHICVPLHTSDVVVFDPGVVHCASNPNHPETSSMCTTHVSAKTINLASSGEHQQLRHL